MKRGFSLIEMLVAMGIFALLMTTTTMIVASTLRAANRATLLAKVRNEGTFAINTMVQTIRFADIASCLSPTSVTATPLNSTTPVVFSYDSTNPLPINAILKDGSALTSDQVRIDSFACTFTPDWVRIVFTIRDKDQVVSATTYDVQITLRN